MRSDYAPQGIFDKILAALMPENELAIRVSIATGLRIGDVLALKPEHVKPTKTRFTIKEQKTGKSRLVYIPKSLREQCFENSGRFWVFEGRTDPTKHRTRQAVFKDIRRSAKAFRVVQHVSPHSARKLFAVNYFQKVGDLGKVRELLNHSSEAVTMVYAMADILTEKKTRKKSGLDKTKTVR